MRKFIIIISCVLIIAIVAVWYFFTAGSQAYSENSSFKSIPLRTPLVLEIPNLSDFLDETKDDDELIVRLREIDFLKDFWARVDSIHLTQKQYEQIAETVGNKAVLVSFNHQGKDGVVPMYSFSLRNNLEEVLLLDELENIAAKKSFALSTLQYDNQTIYHIKWDAFGSHYYTISNGIFIMSPSRMLVEEAMRQIATSNLMDDEVFNKLYTTVNNSSLINIFINHEKINVLLKRVVNKQFAESLKDIASFAEWSEYDLNAKNNQVWMNGYSTIGNKNNSYLSILNRQEAQRFSIDEVISSNSCLFLNFNLNDFDKFQEDYSTYLEQHSKAYYEREARLIEIEKQTRRNLIDLFSEFNGDDYAMVFGNTTQNAPEQNRFFIAKTKSKSIAKDKLIPLIERAAKRQGSSLDDYKSTYQLNEDEKYDIYKFPYADCGELLFGQLFAGVECNYLSFYDNYLIFADSKESLQAYIHDLVLYNTLEEDANFQDFNDELDNRSSIYFYLNFPKIFIANAHYLDKEAAEEAANNEMFIRKLQGFGWQLTQHENHYLNNMYIRFDPDLKEEPQAIWQSVLDSSVVNQAYVVKNHRNKTYNEAIVQDAANNIYLINKEGVQAWKIKLSGRIIGAVHQIDIHGNGRLQYVFNTKEKLYILDRNGNNVGKFPVTLRSPATNGVSVFDYSNKHKYRFFLACEDLKTYAYDKAGNVVTGWRAQKTDSSVEYPIQHMLVNNKDYIVYADAHNSYILDRQGKDRIENSKIQKFEHSNNPLYSIIHNNKQALVTTDTEGTVHFQYMDGKSDDLELENFSQDHFFVAYDVDKDGEDDFIFADKKKLYVYGSDGDEIFTRKFKSTISFRPELIDFDSKNCYIGLTCKDENQVYLVDLDGKDLDGFPLKGNTAFSVGKLSNNSSFYNLLIGYNSNSLLNYSIENN